MESRNDSLASAARDRDLCARAGLERMGDETMTPEDRASNIVYETQLVDNTFQEAAQVEVELIALIAQAIREAVVEEREACAYIASSHAIPILAENITTSGVARELDMVVQIAAAIRARAKTETT